ncbi:hypothetical protein [Roseateles aquatilis]|uniref:hypothetical protein n=1 Tax=Roseateles aquatilis TaxID=431061 RepID=UPI0011326114|nr:hypothetical protein [Roseateles aquatilis]
MSILATDLDLKHLQRALLDHGDIALFSDVPGSDLRSLAPLDALEIPAGEMGARSLICYLVPRSLEQQIYVAQLSDVKFDVDLRRSLVIELWRPYFKDSAMRRGRFFYEDRRLLSENGALKSEPFSAWAERVFRHLRKHLKYDRSKLAYVGDDAGEKLRLGHLTVIN